MKVMSLMNMSLELCVLEADASDFSLYVLLKKMEGKSLENRGGLTLCFELVVLLCQYNPVSFLY